MLRYLSLSVPKCFQITCFVCFGQSDNVQGGDCHLQCAAKEIVVRACVCFLKTVDGYLM